ncbi:MAG: inositol monophosphatase [Chloroflexi bacterium]|nr:inositol monophosphatase [Chloroflexota bacterium]
MADIPLSSNGKTAMDVAREVSLKAGEMVAERFYQVKEISEKGPGDIVTDVDRASEDMIRSMLAEEFPDMGFLGEESSGSQADSGYVWIVDPVDGTRNYALGIPFFSLVVGLALDGEVLVGVNYDPMTREMFHAERGKGAFLNDQPIHVSDKPSLAECIIGMDLGYGSQGAVNGLNVIEAIWPGMYSARIMGSAALGLSYAAAGRFDLYFHHALSPWDQVAGMLLVEEAGGIVTDRNGKRASLYSDGIIASSAAIHADFLRKTEGMAWREPTIRLA